MPARPAAPREARPSILTVRRARVAVSSYTYGLNGSLHRTTAAVGHAAQPATRP